MGLHTGYRIGHDRQEELRDPIHDGIFYGMYVSHEHPDTAMM